MFKDLFKNLFKPEQVKQTGLIYVPPRPTDYLSGTLPYEIRLEDGDWKDYLPQNEEQYLFAKFDTKSCVSFSALNCLEMQLNKMLETHSTHDSIKWLYDQGYVFDGNKVNFSDRYTAITSGTTERGNTLVKVADTIREYGLIPEDFLPMGGNSFEEYHGATIDILMKAKGKEFLNKFEVGYEWVFWNGDNNIDDYEEEAIEKALKHTPLQLAVPIPAGHALSMPSRKYFFDTYYPFYKKVNKPIQVGFKLIIVPKDKPKDKPFKVLKRGSKGKEVKELQAKLKSELPEVKVDGDFGQLTERALKFIQGALNIRVDGIYGEQTKNALEGKNWLPITNFSEPVDDIDQVNHIMVRLVQRIRNALGFAIHYVNGHRTKAKNDRIRGAKNSAHLDGLAGDLVPIGSDRDYRNDLIEREARKLGIVRIGRYPGRHIHLDISLNRDQVDWKG